MLKGYIGISALLIVDLVLYLAQGISISGQISDRVLFWTWLIMTPIVITKYFKKKWAKLYLGTIGLLLVLSLIPMGIPLLTMTAFAINTDYEREVGNFRLREGAKSVISIPQIQLIKRIGILEKELGEIEFHLEIEGEYYQLVDYEGIKIKKENDSLSIEFKIRNHIVKRRIAME